MRPWFCFFALFLVAACQATPVHDAEVHIHTREEQITVYVEVAQTDEARRQGLQHRKQLAANAGMLFVWPEPQQISMWMKNTYIPLDMLFIRQGRIIHIAANTTPHSLDLISPPTPVDAVLEVNAGKAAAWGIQPGQKIEVVYPN